MDETPILVDKREAFASSRSIARRGSMRSPRTCIARCNAALDEAEADSACRALLMTGAGRGFCAGQDLNDRLAKPGEKIVLGGTLEHFYNPLVRKLRALPFPVVAAVNGVAAGAGANIALACDIVIAAKSATFVQPFQDRPCARFRRHLVFAAAGRAGPRARRLRCWPSRCRPRRRRAMGPDLESGRRRRIAGGSGNFARNSPPDRLTDCR